MEQILPWQNMTAVIEPFYPQGDTADGPIRWRPCCVFTACSIGTTLSDGAMEDALYEIASMRLFARLSPDDSALPDRTTIMNFRHLLEQHQLARQLFRPSIAGWPKQASL